MALRIQHRVRLAANLNTINAVTVLAPDGTPGAVFVLVRRCGAGLLPGWERGGTQDSEGLPSPGLAATLSPSDVARGSRRAA